MSDQQTGLKDALQYSVQLAIAAADPKLLNVEPFGDPIPYAVIPKDHMVASLAGQIFHSERPHPTHVEQTHSFVSLDALVRYLNTYKQDSTMVTFTGEGKFTAYLDYHAAPAGPAAWKKHTAQLTLVKSLEFGEWSAKNRKAMSQAEFAEFLDDNQADLVDAAAMMEVSRTLTATKNVQFKSSTDLSNGSSELIYTEDVRGQMANGQAVIPQVFELRIPVFNGEEATLIRARFRYRIEDGKLQLWYILHRPALLALDRIQSACAEIHQATELIPFQIA